jgi:hypothetical protein
MQNIIKKSSTVWSNWERQLLKEEKGKTRKLVNSWEKKKKLEEQLSFMEERQKEQFVTLWIK